MRYKTLEVSEISKVYTKGKIMENINTITGEDLMQRGWASGKVLGMALKVAKQLAAEGADVQRIFATLESVRQHPAAYADDAALSALAKMLDSTQTRIAESMGAQLHAQPISYPVWGNEGIDAAARQQMDNSMRLPISVAGALMPDAHVGYGLPIGGVLATEGAVIPYAVGVDIACRMRLTVFEVSPIVLGQQKDKFEKVLMNHTRFGAGVEWKRTHCAWGRCPVDSNLRRRLVAGAGRDGVLSCAAVLVCAGFVWVRLSLDDRVAASHECIARVAH